MARFLNAHAPYKAPIRLDEGPPSAMPESEAVKLIQHMRRWFTIFVFIVPVLAALLYNFVIATPRYASEIAFVVRASETPRDRLSIVSLGQGGGIGTSDNSEAVLAYLQSRDIVDFINRDGLVTRTFAKSDLDLFAAFPSLIAGNSDEDFYEHFHGYVHADFDRATDIIHVQVQSFTPANARAIAQRLLNASEEMVNRLNKRAQANVVGGAERDVAQAADQLTAVLARMTSVRNRDRIIQPELDSEASIKLQSGTAAELARTEVQLAQTLRSAPQSPLISRLRAQRAALDKQLRQQIGATAGGNGSLASRLREYEALAPRRDIAQRQFAAASLALLSARGSASRQQLYLEEIARPNLPDEARYPRGWLNLLLTVLVAGAVLWIVLSLAELVFSDE